MPEDFPDRSAPRHSDPPRPDFVAGVPMQPEIHRPWIVNVVVAFVVLAGVAFIPYTALAVPQRQAIRARLEKELADRSPDYPAADVEQAVLYTLIGLAVISVIFVLAEIRAALQLRRKRRGGRTWLLVLTVMHVPVIAMSPFIRDLGQWDMWSAAAQASLLAIATALAYVPPVSAWLRAVKRQGPIPLRTTAERQS